ncbi:MAG: hypothetical protein V4542_02145 [Pseudomonadota bacterium]
MITIQHSIIGLPGSGKTTFLAALWHELNAEEVPTKFRLEKLDGDASHLNAIADAWRRCEEVPRTSSAAEVALSIHVREDATSKLAVLHFSDLSGESFELQLSSRSCTEDYVKSFEGQGGILLFVSADRPGEAMTILDIAPALEGEAIEEDPAEHVDWSPKMVSEQVNLVDLLQFLQQAPFARFRRRVAVIISAWDVVTQPISPQQWLFREMPFLAQFLTCNSESFAFQVYGVSAQGGKVTTEFRHELAKMVASKRISCIGPNTNSHDLTSPIAWLMESE